ncbi:MAG: hypothetical protein EXR03_02015 [Pseudolabrys sp.]|nr:hypothetical protein [Pseudolabrys sp.]
MKRPWWKTGFVLLAWIAAFVIVAALGSGLSSGGGVPLWVWALFALGAFNLAYSNITDRLDAIQWQLDDLKERLPNPHEAAFDDLN